MPIRQRLVTYGIPTAAVATVTLAALLSPWTHRAAAVQAEPLKPVEAPMAAHPVDVVFAVDTTGSMGGLIEGAKRTVWSIATHIHQTDPNASLRIGLVAYRDLGDDYVTKDFALTTDLDAVFAELSAYRANGGGDIPEDVDAALYDAVHKMAWRPDAKKLVFLVGDAPPATRGDVPAYQVTVNEAAKQQIVINTIRCGEDPDTKSSWLAIADAAHGEFSSIQEDGGVQQVATPYDAKMAALSATIDHSAVIYGDASTRGAYAGKMAAAAAAPAPAMADRAAFYAGAKGAKRDDADVTGAVAGGAMSVDALDPDKLPADLQGLSKDRLKATIAQRAAERANAEKELGDLAKQRAAYLKKAGPSDGFDAKVKSTLDAELK